MILFREEVGVLGEEVATESAAPPPLRGVVLFPLPEATEPERERGVTTIISPSPGACSCCTSDKCSGMKLEGALLAPPSEPAAWCFGELVWSNSDERSSLVTGADMVVFTWA